VLAHTQVVK